MNTEEYLLDCLAEECAEVIQRVTKSKRFGLEEVQQSNPEETRNNRERIQYEVNDLLAVLELLAAYDHSYANFEVNAAQRREKHAKLRKYMEYSRSLGILK